MPNLLQTGAAWLGERLQDCNGQEVTVTQGAKVLSITASLAMHDHEVIDDGGFPTRVTSFDWTFVASDLEGLIFRPGALIQDASGVHYEAMSLGQKPCLERLDSSGVLQTLHTKKVTRPTGVTEDV